ncbi:hypothetical protein SACS_1188 [Parasaccharibacter apium]|uniref:Uncharacterized protein n=1 Tax=Parasaccharibacter apium TaxID=1510841 RepID=A0A7U7G6A6_9PROT|nr:hypothetical protein [Parasaccharibacter apium]CDG33926.1 hypothetical protein SACS_1188 [Parasaccharibacter apium]
MSDFDFTQTSSKQQEIAEKLGNRAIWTSVDNKVNERRRSDEEETNFLADVLERYGYSVRKETVYLRSILDKEHDKQFTPVKEHSIFPVVLRKKTFKNSNLIEAWGELSSTDQQGIINVKSKKESSEKKELVCPGTFGDNEMKPRYAVFTDGKRCDVSKLREKFKNLRQIARNLDKTGAHFQSGTIEITIREYSDGKVDFHPHINVLNTNSKKNLKGFRKRVNEQFKGKFWKDLGEISLKDIPKVARYITKIGNRHMSNAVKEDDISNDDGRIISVYELAERHPDIFISLYNQLHRQALVIWGNELKTFREFLSKWGHDVRKVRIINGRFINKFYRKSNRISLYEK